MDGKYWDSSVETLPRKDIELIQWRRLKSQIEYVYANSKFYHKKMRNAGITPSDIQTKKDFEKRFPITTKDEVRAEMLLSNDPLPHLCVPRENICRIHRSSGTTGLPTFNAYTWEDTENWAEIFCRIWYMMGLRPKDRLMYVIWNGSLSVPIIAAASRKMGFEVAFDDIHVVSGFTDNAMLSHCTVLFGGTNIPPLMEEELRKRNKTPSDVTSFRFQALSGDVMSKARRKSLTKTWGSEIFSYGGAAEVNLVYGECEEHNGLHVLDEDFFIHETLSLDSDESIQAGEKGRLVVTDLLNKASPHIRFDLGDVVIANRDTCNCGRTHSRLKILGRSTYSVKIGDLTIFPTEIEEVIRDNIDSLSSEFQIIKYAAKLDKLQINIGLGEQDRNEVLKAKISSDISSKFGVKSDISFVDLASIPRAPGGHKVMRIVDKTST